jgi:hypothetical protein
MSGALTISKDAKEYANGIDPDVEVNIWQGSVYFDTPYGSSAYKTKILAVKKRVGEYLKNKYPDRKFVHATHRGFKVWNTYAGERVSGLRTGIKIVLTDAEHSGVLAGPSSWERVAGGKKRHAPKKPQKRKRTISPGAAKALREINRMLRGR